MQTVLNAAQHATERLSVKSSALNPLLWLCTVPTAILLASAVFFDRSPTLRMYCGPLVWVALGSVSVTGLAGLYLVVFRPEKMQSEEYQLRQQALQLIQQSSAPRHAISASEVAALMKSVAPRR